MGHRICWEVLLVATPESCDLVMVSRDGDYTSELDGSASYDFLADEWAELKFGEVSIHRTLSESFATYDLDIELSVETE